MALRIVDNQMAMVKPMDNTAADRARDMRQTGLQTGTIQDINRDADDTMHTVRDKPEVESGIVRTDSESESAGNQEQPPQERDKEPPEDDLQRQASERLLNLPVSSSKVTVETRSFDIRV